MALERKVYSGWAYTENELEKSKINRDLYNDLMGKYKISYSSRAYNAKTKCMEDINLDNYDLVVSGSSGYAHVTYSIIKNNTNLSYDEIALVCDRGNLCFGYRVGSNGSIIVDTD